MRVNDIYCHIIMEKRSATIYLGGKTCCYLFAWNFKLYTGGLILVWMLIGSGCMVIVPLDNELPAR